MPQGRGNHFSLFGYRKTIVKEKVYIREKNRKKKNEGDKYTFKLNNLFPHDFQFFFSFLYVSYKKNLKYIYIYF